MSAPQAFSRISSYAVVSSSGLRSKSSFGLATRYVKTSPLPLPLRVHGDEIYERRKLSITYRQPLLYYALSVITLLLPLSAFTLPLRLPL